MKDSFILQDENYISARRVHELFGYTSDYVGQLCRAGKLKSKMIGRSWFVTEKSVFEHKSQVSETPRNKNKIKFIPVSLPVVTSLTVVSESAVVAPKTIGLTQIIIPEHPITLAPQNFALPYYISSSFLQAPVFETYETVSVLNFKNIALTAGVLVIAFVFLFQSTFPAKIKNTETANLLSASKEIIAKIFSFFSPKTSELVEETKTVEADFNGLAVVPSTKTVSGDENIKQKIRDSFSDEVVVKPDSSGTAGIITPVFRKAKGDDFVYVLVPVDP